MTARARLRRQLAFGQIALADLFAQFVGLGAVNAACAVSGFGPFSLVLGMLVQIFLQSVGYRWGVTGAYRMTTNVSMALPTLRIAYAVGKISIVEIVRGQIPIAFVGPILGSSVLGIFTRAYSLAQLPMEILTMAITRVLLPSFVIVRDDRERFNRVLYQILECVAPVGFPAAAGIAASGPQLVVAL